MTFQSLVHEFLDREFELSPVRASQLGLTEFDGRLDDLSADAFRARDREAASWLDRFDALDGAELTPDERIDRDLVRSVLRGRLIMADWEDWRRDPVTYTNRPRRPLRLFLHRLRPETELIEAAVSRIGRSPAALAEGARTWTRRWPIR